MPSKKSKKGRLLSILRNHPDSSALSRATEVLGVELSLYPFTYPRTYPRSGDTLSCEFVLCSQAFRRGRTALRHPRHRSVLWLARRGYYEGAALAKNLPHRSRENEFTACKQDLWILAVGAQYRHERANNDYRSPFEPHRYSMIAKDQNPSQKKYLSEFIVPRNR
jgi:hypothetical protein